MKARSELEDMIEQYDDAISDRNIIVARQWKADINAEIDACHAEALEMNDEWDAIEADNIPENEGMSTAELVKAIEDKAAHKVRKITAEQIERTKKEYSRVAAEPVDIEVIGETLYAFGSELATLRLFRKMPSCAQGYSENLKTFYISIDL